jgi:hypothetical protein
MERVRRDQRGTYIIGVPPERPLAHIWHLDGLLAALRAMLSYHGVEQHYLEDDILAAISGQAFRFWASPLWEECLAYTQEEGPALLARVLGFDYVWRQGRDGGAGWRELIKGQDTLDHAVAAGAWRELQREIDAGHPVLLFGADPAIDPKAGPCVVTGYDDTGEQIYFLPHSDWRPAPAWDAADPECEAGIAAKGYRARARPDETNWVGMQYAPVPRCAMGESSLSFFAFRRRQRIVSEHQLVLSALERGMRLGRGELFDPYRPHIRSGLPALELMAHCLAQGGESYEWYGRRQRWDQIGDWLYALEGLIGPGYRRAASVFMARCVDGLGRLTPAGRALADQAVAAYAEAGRAMAAFSRGFAEVGPLDGAEERIETLRRAFGSYAYRRRAAAQLEAVWHAEAQAVSHLTQIVDIHTGSGQGGYG